MCECLFSFFFVFVTTCNTKLVFFYEFILSTRSKHIYSYDDSMFDDVCMLLIFFSFGFDKRKPREIAKKYMYIKMNSRNKINTKCSGC